MTSITTCRSKDFDKDLSPETKKLPKQQIEVLATVSHEIRTGLNAIVGISDLLQKATGEEQTEYLETLKLTSGNLMELVNNVLDFSKLVSGRLKMTPRATNLEESINRSLFAHKNQAKAKGLKFVVDIDSRFPELINVDAIKLNQIVINLVSNAIKFTEKGSITVSVKLVKSSASKVWALFAVKDTGIGIRPEHLRSIFKAFNQGDEEINIKYAGTGLGLNISKQLVTMLGGKMRVESIEGEGTEFSYILPLKILNSSDNNPVLSREQETNRENAAKNIKVLLVEDNKINVLITEKYLKFWGADFVTVNNGLEAVKMVQQQDFDLVLMDMHLPEMDGCEASDIIRKLPGEKYQDLPIIALTASSEGFYSEKIKKIGMNDYINKPFPPEELLKKIVFYSRTEY